MASDLGDGVDAGPATDAVASTPIALVGTTASGKSALALEVARRRGDVEIVSVDSMQVYRGMDIGTAKATAAEQAEVRHHLLDVVDPWEDYSLVRFQAAARAALADIEARGRHALLVGGTGLYLRAVVDGFEVPGRFPAVADRLEAEIDSSPDGPDAAAAELHARLARLDPPAAARMEPSNRRRVVRALEVTLGSGRPFSSFGPGLDAHPDSPVRMFGLWLPRPVVADRIEARYRQQMVDGFLDEVRRLAAGPPLSATAAQALGYRELLAHLEGRSSGQGNTDPAEAVAEAVRRTRRFARRQRVWFRRDPRITWIGADRDPRVALPALLREVETVWGPPERRGR